MSEMTESLCLVAGFVTDGAVGIQKSLAQLIERGSSTEDLITLANSSDRPRQPPTPASKLAFSIYLLKPFDGARFDSALKRAKERLRERREARKAGDRFIIRETGQISFVKISDIDWIEAADYYACLHVGSKTHLLRRSLAELEEELKPAFCRIHRSTIVNLERVQSLKLNREGEYDVLLGPGTALRLSRRYRKQLQARLGIHDSAGAG